MWPEYIRGADYKDPTLTAIGLVMLIGLKGIFCFVKAITVDWNLVDQVYNFCCKITELRYHTSK